jgi:DNA polymerase-3 subunit alpha
VAEFAHLHLHTQYSLLDGAIRTKELFPRVRALGMDTVAVTDHGNLFGAIDLYLESKKHDVKLIFGCETYVAATDRTDRTNRRSYHLVLLAQNDVGYRNLSYLNSMGYLEGLYYKPRIDKQLLREHSEGLIGMSACLGGEVAQTLEKLGVAAAEEVAREYAATFAPGDFFLELMPTATPEQQGLNDELRRMGAKLGIPLVASNDCHYVAQTDAAAHEVLMAIQLGKSLKDDKRLRHQVDSYYIKSPAEMDAHFKDVPQALESAAAIAARCNVQLKFGETHLPNYRVPEGETLDTYIGALVEQGLERRFRELTARGRKFDADEYRARCRTELGVIQRMGFSGYFLIVWDFIAWAKTQGIPVGPGRGSGAGSAVAWALRITDIDPIEFKLLFERFLNPERVSMPDFDVDFCMNGRDDVIKYVQGKYGKDQVGQIATFHQLKARGVIRDIARVMDIPFGDADRLAKLVPEPEQGKHLPVRQAVELTPELKALYDESPVHRTLLDLADRLENLNRNAGMHAAGIVITERPVWEHVPCFRGPAGELVTQFDKNAVEKAGLVKFDFLGLKTLTVIAVALRLVNEQREDSTPPLDIALISKDDHAVYELIARGDTTGVFQLESSGLRAMLRQLKPDNLEDVVAAVALYRPGPLKGGMVKSFIERKHGREPITYPHPALEQILADTYGVIVYQEQVMQIAQVLAGYSLGRADLLRRVMSKKDGAAMAAEKGGFVAAAIERGVAAQTAAEIFDLLAFFADYGFNRSHAAAYAWVTYQTAYLKHHHPHEFVAGLLTCSDDAAEIAKLVADTRAAGLVVVRPDINASQVGFTVEQSGGGKQVRFGLASVGGVGSGAVEALVRERGRGGDFSSLDELCRRADLQRCNARVLEALIKAGAFDGVGGGPAGRAALIAGLPAAMQRGASAAKDRRSGQASLFGAEVATARPERAAATSLVAPWSDKETLAFEKEALGFYLSGHPVDAYAKQLALQATGTTLSITSGDHAKGAATIGGVVRDYREILTKKGDRMAVFSIEDAVGTLPAVCFPEAFVEARPSLVRDEPLLFAGTVGPDTGPRGDGGWKMQVAAARPLAGDDGGEVAALEIHVDAERDEERMIPELAALLREHRGTVPVTVHVHIPGRSETTIGLPPEYATGVDAALLQRITALFGRRVTRVARRLGLTDSQAHPRRR